MFNFNFSFEEVIKEFVRFLTRIRTIESGYMEQLEEKIEELRGMYPVLFQEEASDIWILMQRCHWYIWLFLVFILVFVLSMFFLILVDSYSNVRYIRDVNSLMVRYSVLQWEKVTHIPRIEFIWTVLPCIFLVFIGYRSLHTLYLIDTPLNVNIIVKAMGRQWFWQYEIVENYPPLFGFDFTNLNKRNNKIPLRSELKLNKNYYFDSYMVTNIRECGYVYDVPGPWFIRADLNNYRRNLSVDNAMSLVVGSPVRFLTTGMDVLHSFAIPSLGIKLDAVPGRLNSSDVSLIRPGFYTGQCSELCGQGHGYMPIGLYIRSY